MIDRAVILAAGLGNRISAVAKDTPKPLLSLDGTPGGPTFLDWHLAALARAGCRDVYLGGNDRTCGAPLRAPEGTRATWILNPTKDLSTSGSAHSAWFAWNAPQGILDGTSRVVLMDADLVYDPALFELLASDARPESKTLVCSDFRDTDEEVLVFADAAGVPRLHGKGLLRTPLVEGLTCLGEATGIVLLEPGDHALVRGATDWCVRFSTAKARSEHEDVTQRMMMIGRVRASRFAAADHDFMECDTPDEYDHLVRVMMPRLRA